MVRGWDGFVRDSKFKSFWGRKKGENIIPHEKKRLTGIKCVTVYNHYSLTVTKQLTALAQKISYYF